MFLYRDGKDAGPALLSLEENLDQLNPAELKSLRSFLGSLFYYRLRDPVNAKRLWSEVAKNSPGDSSIRLSLFNLAKETNDDAGMLAAMEEIKKALSTPSKSGEESAEWKYAAAARQMMLYRSDKKANPGAIEKARNYLLEAKDLRPNWDRLARLSAEISSVVGDLDGISSGLSKTVAANPGDLTTTTHYLELLSKRNQWDQARHVVDRMPAGPRPKALNKLVATVYLKTNAPDKAVESARVAISDDDPDPADHIWQGVLLFRAGRADESEQAFRRAIDVDPTDQAAWLHLVELLSSTEQKAKIAPLMRDAKKKLPASKITLVTAQALDILNKQENAEKFYAKAAKENPTDLSTLKSVADYYLRNEKSDHLAQTLDQMLSLPEPTDPEDKQHYLWARITKAQQLAAQGRSSTGDYKKFIEALDLLNSGSGATVGEVAIKTQLLAQRPEPEHWMKALAGYELIRTQRPLLPQEQSNLAKLYHRAGENEKAQQEMISLITRTNNNPEIINTYVNMLISQGNLRQAEQWNKSAMRAAKGDDSARLRTVVNQARILAKRGENQEAKDLIRSLLPDPIPAEKLPLLAILARVCENNIKQYDLAEEFWKEYAEKDPKPGTILALAAFYTRRGDFKNGLGIMNQIVSNPKIATSWIEQFVSVANQGLHANKSKARPIDYEIVSRWIQIGRKRDPDSVVLLSHSADLNDLRGNLDQAISEYEQIVNRQDIPEKGRAVMMNNLAFIYALKQGEAQKGMELIERAIKILGPSVDLLDTRAMVNLALGNTEEALEDLQQVVLGSEDPVKFFHLAWALDANNEKSQAEEAMRKALTLGLNTDLLTAPEKIKYDKLIQQLGLADFAKEQAQLVAG